MILAGEIAGPPTASGVMVLLHQLDGGRDQHGPCAWQPLPDGTEPRRGDRCVVLEDDSGALWVAAWRPT